MIAGVGTGKTLFLLAKILHYCENYPNSLALIVRKEYTDLRDSTLKDFERYTGRGVDGNKEFHLDNKSTIMFRHGDEINVLKNINLSIFGIEQAEEFESDETFTFLRDRLRRDNAPYRQGCIIGNTNGDNWIKRLWKDKQLSHAELFEASTFDNADNLPADFIENLKRLETEAPAHYKQYILNDWTITGDQFILIRPETIGLLKGVIFYRHKTKRVIACDPSQGGDECVIYVIENTKIIDEKILHENDTMKIAGELAVLGQKYDIKDYAIDTIGIGKGIVDRLMELGKNVNAINSAEKADQPERFYNRRTEMWWYAMDQILKREVDYMIDPELRRQLSSVRYKVVNSNGQIKLEPKDETKKRLERSPDRADAFIYGLWALKDVVEYTPYMADILPLDNLMAGGRAGY
jgi:hypothetical protein